MIVLPAPGAPAAAAAWRIARGTLPFWLASPGPHPASVPAGSRSRGDDVAVTREFVGSDPVRIVRGVSVDALERAWLEERASWRGPPGVPIGVGFLGYDLGRRFQQGRVAERPGSGWPEMEFRFYDAVWARDSASGEAKVLARDERAGRRLLDRLAAPDEGAALPRPLRDAPGADGTDAGPRDGDLGALQAMDAPSDFVAGVRRILAYLRAGDAYQVNLARRLAARMPPAAPGAPIGLALMARLQAGSPAPHALWLADPDEGACLIGNSPERFLRVDAEGRIETRPIKGTRPRHPGPGDDAAVADLARHPKDLAEHTMIVDLERNDLGRVCVPGSVGVEGFARTASLPTLHHLVSTVRGRLRTGVGLAEILRATFPGGSVTGAPKIRAMQIIDELEAAPRGPYTGATGWLGAAGDLDLAVTIRTALVRDRRLVLWVGAGIVADSDPAAELDETEVKAAAFRRALAGG